MDVYSLYWGGGGGKGGARPSSGEAKRTASQLRVGNQKSNGGGGQWGGAHDVNGGPCPSPIFTPLDA